MTINPQTPDLAFLGPVGRAYWEDLDQILTSGLPVPPFGTCDICREPFGQNDRRIRCLYEGGDVTAVGRNICVECAQDRPIYLMPDYRPGVAEDYADVQRRSIADRE